MDEVVSVDVEVVKVQVDLSEAMMRLRAKSRCLSILFQENISKRTRKNALWSVWRKGNLRFNSTPIHDVAKELERMYNCRITFAEGQNFDNLISGEHDNKSLDAVLQAVEYTSGIHYKRMGNMIQLYK